MEEQNEYLYDDEEEDPVRKKGATRLTRWEMETTVNFNADEKTATLYTRDKAIMRRLDKRVAKHPEVYKLVSETDIDKIYSFPKRLLNFRAPRTLTDEQRAQIARRLAKSRGNNEPLDEDDLSDDIDEDEDLLDEEDPFCQS